MHLQLKPTQKSSFALPDPINLRTSTQKSSCCIVTPHQHDGIGSDFPWCTVLAEIDDTDPVAPAPYEGTCSCRHACTRSSARSVGTTPVFLTHPSLLWEDGPDMAGHAAPPVADNLLESRAAVNSEPNNDAARDTLRHRLAFA